RTCSSAGRSPFNRMTRGSTKMLPRSAANVQDFIALISLVDADEALGVPQLEIHNGVPRLSLHLVEKNAFHEHPLFAGKSLDVISPFHVPFPNEYSAN